MTTQNQIVQQMIQGLSITLPTLDTTIGSPVRQILDVVSETISEQTMDQYLLTYQYDVNTMQGANLDAFVALFGMTRYSARRAVGYITLSRGTPALTDQLYVMGTAFSTIGSPSIVFATIIPAVLLASTESVTIPIQASIGGVTGNVAASSITQGIGGALASVTTITNVNATTGGADAESDQALISRAALSGSGPLQTHQRHA